MKEPWLHWHRFGDGGLETTLVFLHATGLNASAYRPILSRLGAHFNVYAPSLRGHGATRLAADPEKLRDWWLFAKDVVTDLQAWPMEGRLILAGHSAGAVTALLAARELKPSAVLMVEPVVLPAAAVWLARSPLKRLTTDKIKIARDAARRRERFPSLDAARKAYRSRSFFRSWDEAAFEGYLEEGFEDHPEGGVALRCTPSWEAAMFRAQGHGYWPHVQHASAQGIPLHVLAASQRSTAPQALRPKMFKRGIALTEVQGSHMIPVEAPHDVADWITAQSKV
ncbi:MAG: alpha/beta hydrolase [Pseudomonadota bacterium]